VPGPKGVDLEGKKQGTKQRFGTGHSAYPESENGKLKGIGEGWVMLGLA